MLSWEYPPHIVGGLGAHVAEALPALARDGAAVTLVTPRWKGGAEAEWVHPNARVYRVTPPVSEISNFFADVQQTNLTLEQFAHTAWEQADGFDLIHAHDWLVGFAAQALKKIYKTPLIVTIHATERGRGRGALHGEMAQAIHGAEWWLTYEAWRVIATSHFMADEVQRYFDLPQDKIAVIPNGVDASRYAALSATERDAWRAQWAEPHERIVYFVGRLQQEKGLFVLVDAARQALAVAPNVKFIIAGTGSILGALRAQVQAWGLSDRIWLPGYISDMMRDQLFQMADVAVAPSLYEPFGIVALEAMAAQCPVIVSDVGGLSEVVDDGLTGIKIPPDRSDLLAQAILQSLNARAQAAEMAERAYAVVCRMYTWEHIARAHVNLYHDVMERRRATVWH
ncbi:MAG: Glycogen synthase [Anaerolineae bacterium]|nr:Glycogen synthase [Anaerolineae bacterium]